MKRINDYFTSHDKLTLALTWIFTAISVAVAVTAILVFPEWGYLKFLECIAFPVILAVYFRTIYGRVQDRRRRELEAQGKLANQIRYGHNKKKKKH